jgi:hypothetical protein
MVIIVGQTPVTDGAKACPECRKKAKGKERRAQGEKDMRYEI